MTLTDKIDELMDPDYLTHEALGTACVVRAGQPCDGCGEVRFDVDLWATNSETGDEVWLCVPCGEW